MRKTVIQNFWPVFDQKNFNPKISVFDTGFQQTLVENRDKMMRILYCEIQFSLSKVPIKPL